MDNFKTRPNLSNLQFRQEQNTVLDLKGITKVLPNGQIRIAYDGKLILEGDYKLIGSGHPVVKAIHDPGGDDHGLLYKEFVDFSGLTFTIYQENHGFNVGDVIGFEDEPPDGDGEGKYSKAIADGTYNGEPLGLATDIIDDDYFVLMQVGFAVLNESLIPGKVYYLSANDAGKMVLNPPTQIGHIIKPIFLPVKDQNTGETNKGWVLPYPPTEIKSFLMPYVIGNLFPDPEYPENEHTDSRDFEINHGLNTTNLLVHAYRYHPPYSTIFLRTDRVDQDGNETNNHIMIRFTKPPPHGEKYKILVGV